MRPPTQQTQAGTGFPAHDMGGLAFNGDLRLVPDPSSLRRCGWHPGHAMAFCSLQLPGKGAHVPALCQPSAPLHRGHPVTPLMQLRLVLGPHPSTISVASVARVPRVRRRAVGRLPAQQPEPGGRTSACGWR